MKQKNRLQLFLQQVHIYNNEENTKEGDKMTHADKAVELFKEGCNCAQAVFLAFNDIMGYEQKTALKISSSFGGGFGRMREVCGAVSGMCMVLGTIYGYDDIESQQLKKEHYARIQKCMKEFREVNGTYICRELIGEEGKDTKANPTERTNDFYKRRPCSELVRIAAEITDKYIKENPIDDM